MGTTRTPPQRLLPDGTPLRNRLLAVLSADAYAAVSKDLRMIPVEVGETLLETACRRSSFTPNSGVHPSRTRCATARWSGSLHCGIRRHARRERLSAT